MAADNWWDNNLINPYIIKNCFIITGLSNKLDDSEDELFTGFKRLKEFVVVDGDDYEKQWYDRLKIAIRLLNKKFYYKPFTKYKKINKIK